MRRFFNKKPVLVTGGAGFIGSHLCRKLVEAGAQITVLDNLSTGSLSNLASIENKITFIEGSVTDYAACLRATEGAALVFHLAAFISVPQSFEDPLGCYETNITGTANLLEASRHQRVEHLLLSSSSAVYGTVEGVCDEQTPCNPTSPYGFSKLMAEEHCRHYSGLFDLKTSCLRYFNVFGEDQSPQGEYAAVLAKFRHQLKNSLPMTIFGDGSQTRDFIPVERVVEANMVLAQHQGNGEAYNIASGASISLKELVQRLRQEYPLSTSTLEFKPPREGDIKHSSASIARYLEKTQRSF
jgi:nucleoside-diphosphate-sugar epimerase